MHNIPRVHGASSLKTSLRGAVCVLVCAHAGLRDAALRRQRVERAGLPLIYSITAWAGSRTGSSRKWEVGEHRCGNLSSLMSFVRYINQA